MGWNRWNPELGLRTIKFRVFSLQRTSQAWGYPVRLSKPEDNNLISLGWINEVCAGRKDREGADVHLDRQ